MQWLGCRILDQRVPGSNPARCAVRSVLEQVKFTPCLVLIKTRKWWTDNRLGQTLMRLETTLCLMCVVQGTYSLDLTTWTKLYHTHIKNMIETLQISVSPEPLHHFNETCYVSFGTSAYHSFLTWADNDLFYVQVKFCN